MVIVALYYWRVLLHIIQTSNDQNFLIIQSILQYLIYYFDQDQTQLLNMWSNAKSGSDPDIL